MSFKKAFGRNELTEIVNLPVLKYIVKNWKKFEPLIVKEDQNDYDYNPQSICEKYLSRYNTTCTIKYNKSTKYPSKLGRWFCKQGVGIQSMPRIIRHTICDGLWIDLDFKNCHPCILRTLCHKNNIKCDRLSDYIDNRDKYHNEWSEILGIDVDDVKTNVFLPALNGNKTYYDLPNWCSILEELKSIHASIANLPQYSMILQEVESNESKNIHAKVVNRVMCEIENQCLQSLYKNLDIRGLLNVEIDNYTYKCCSLIFDGLQIPLNEQTKSFCTADNFKLLSNLVLNDTGYLLVIDQKPFNNKLPNIPDDLEEEDDEDFIIDNDGDAAEHIISKYSHLMVNCNNIKYVKIGHIWTCDVEKVKSSIYGWIYNTSIKRYVGDKLVFYNRNKSDINKCVDIIMGNWNNFIPNSPNFIDDNIIKSKCYLPFANGVYCMKNKTLLKYEDIDIQFTQIINRDFPTFDQKAYDTLMEKVIIPILPDPMERQYFIYCLARALAGHYEDKKWFINKGSRNSGKGVLTKLLQKAFQIFVGTFNSGALTRKQNENADDAKNLSWVVKLKDKRLIISNEVQEEAILNGKMCKQLASGGDTILGRVNYQDEIEFVPQFTMMLQLNNIGGIEPVDALESCEQFLCKSKFVSKEELIEGQPFLKLKDDKIKHLLDEDKIIEAFTLYVLDNYADYLATPESVKFSTEELKADIPLTLEQVILKHFRTGDGKMYTEDIINNIVTKTEYDDNIDSKKLHSILLKCNIGSRTSNGKISINGVKKMGYNNIVFIDDNSNREFDYE